MTRIAELFAPSEPMPFSSAKPLVDIASLLSQRGAMPTRQVAQMPRVSVWALRPNSFEVPYMNPDWDAAMWNMEQVGINPEMSNLRMIPRPIDGRSVLRGMNPANRN